MIVSPSILSADFSKLYEEVKSVYDLGAEYIHIDVMDGHFVPNITIGALVYKEVAKLVPMVYDVHLMISDPEKYINEFVNAGANIITFHYETGKDCEKIIAKIKSAGVKAGISIKPGTDVAVLLPYLQIVDLVLVMSVEPGFGGQTFMNSALDKIRYLKKLKNKNGYQYLIEVDGGINYDTAKLVSEAGAEIVVAGTYVYKSSDRSEVIKYLRSL